MTTREFDIVLFGATGLAGGYSARTLAKHRGDLRIAIAGRNAKKIEEIASELDVGFVIADAGDPKALEAMTKKTRVVASTTGPFARYGSALVEMCIDNNTHYCDITGEIPWARKMIEQHQERALKNKTRLISFAGFDSVPSDVGAYLCVKALRERGEGTKDVQGVFKIKGGFSGGTAASALSTFEGEDTRETLRALGDPFGLCPDLQVPKGARRENPNSLKPKRFRDKTLAPFFMEPVNTRVVRRSQLLAEQSGETYGEGFRYNEHLDVGKSAQTLKAWGASAALFTGGALLTKPFGRSLMGRFMPKKGEGPTREQIEGGYTRADFYATGDKGSEVHARVECKGDPGNITTSRTLAATAICLASSDDGAPAGFMTPTYFGGDRFIDVLNDLDVSSSVLETN